MKKIITHIDNFSSQVHFIGIVLNHSLKARASHATTLHHPNIAGAENVCKIHIEVHFKLSILNH
jgi:hypothetical protein